MPPVYHFCWTNLKKHVFKICLPQGPPTGLRLTPSAPLLLPFLCGNAVRHETTILESYTETMETRERVRNRRLFYDQLQPLYSAEWYPTRPQSTASVGRGSCFRVQNGISNFSEHHQSSNVIEILIVLQSGGSMRRPIVGFRIRWKHILYQTVAQIERNVRELFDDRLQPLYSSNRTCHTNHRFCRSRVVFSRSKYFSEHRQSSKRCSSRHAFSFHYFLYQVLSKTFPKHGFEMVNSVSDSSRLRRRFSKFSVFSFNLCCRLHVFSRSDSLPRTC